MKRRLKVVFCWEEVNGYMAACWNALQARNCFDITIVGGRPGALLADNKYSTDIMGQLDAHLLTGNELHNSDFMQALFKKLSPDIIFIPGWSLKGLNTVVQSSDLKHCKFVMGFDTPRLDTWRQRLARLKIGRLLARMDSVVVPGERSWQFATQLLKVPETKMRRGLYGVDFQSFAPALKKRMAKSWPKRFVYTGRYAAIKGIDVLAEAYTLYRSSVSDPWPLTCCGSGVLGDRLNQTVGIENRGFVQPSQLPDIFSEQGAFVLASRHDPWPLVLVEAAASGLPIVCSNACGSAVELVRPYYNGLTALTANARDLSHKLKWIHDHFNKLPEMGTRSQQLANAYSSEIWADRWQEYIEELRN